MARFEKGNSGGPGRPKGALNKKVLQFRERLLEHGCDVDAELAKAIISGNVDMIRALQGLLNFFQPKLKETDAPTADVEPSEVSEKSTLDLLKSVAK